MKHSQGPWGMVLVWRAVVTKRMKTSPMGDSQPATLRRALHFMLRVSGQEVRGGCELCWRLRAERAGSRLNSRFADLGRRGVQSMGACAASGTPGRRRTFKPRDAKGCCLASAKRQADPGGAALPGRARGHQPELSTRQRATRVRQRFQIKVHPRTLEKALQTNDKRECRK